MGSKVGQKPVVVRKTEKLGEREHKALFPSEVKGHDDDEHLYLKNLREHGSRYVRHEMTKYNYQLTFLLETRKLCTNLHMSNSVSII